ncbi:RING-3 [Halenospora varia]|nr:RING-3 [Halenospora varia]
MASQPQLQPQEQWKGSKKGKQACDYCRARKIRCDSNNPCSNCQSTQPCIYSLPKKKGPKRREASQAAFQTVKEYRDPRVNIPQSPKTGISVDSAFQTSSLLSLETMQSCLDAFFEQKYPIIPIIDRDQMSASLLHLQDSPSQYSLVTAICALMTLQSETSPPSRHGPSLDSPHIDSKPSVNFLINETCRARNFCNYIDEPSLATVQSSFFLFAVFFCLERDNTAWFYMREAITMLQLLRLHEEASYTTMNDIQYSTYCRRTFWLLFVTERAYALQRHHPLTLRRTIALPTVEQGPEATILFGFLDLVALFQNFGDAFLSLWNLSSGPTASLPFLAKLQDVLQYSIPYVNERTDIQKADLLVSRQWLKTVVWKLCVSNGLLSSKSAVESLSFRYPVTIARDIILALRLLPLKAIQANGIGILEKVFDIGCSLADVLSVNPNTMQVSALEIGPRDYLMELVQIVGMELGGSSKFSRLLSLRADECLRVRLRGSLCSSNDSHGVHEIHWKEAADTGDVVFEPMILIGSG